VDAESDDLCIPAEVLMEATREFISKCAPDRTLELPSIDAFVVTALVTFKARMKTCGDTHPAYPHSYGACKFDNQVWIFGCDLRHRFNPRVPREPSLGWSYVEIVTLEQDMEATMVYMIPAHLISQEKMRVFDENAGFSITEDAEERPGITEVFDLLASHAPDGFSRFGSVVRAAAKDQKTITRTFKYFGMFY
jgi:hypothetical protein